MKTTISWAKALPFLVLGAVVLFLWRSRTTTTGNGWQQSDILAATQKAKALYPALRPATETLLSLARQHSVQPMLEKLPYLLNPQENGALKYIGMEAGWNLGKLNQAVLPDLAGRDFMLSHRNAFGLENPRVDLSLLRRKSPAGREIHRFQQTYGGLPIFASQAILHAKAGGHITTIITDTASDFSAIDALPLPLTFRKTWDQAGQAASAWLAQNLNQTNGRAIPDQPATLSIYCPEVLGLEGVAEVAWAIEMTSEAFGMPQADLVIVSAHDGRVLQRINRQHGALSREVYDYNLTDTTSSTPARANNAPPIGNAEVDSAYDFSGRTWSFLHNNHGRDSYNNAGATIKAFVQLRKKDANGNFVRYHNASASGDRITFGEGWVADDVVAHEIIHNVNRHENGLLYLNDSGAIDESLADIWGEVIDQIYVDAADSAATRWLIGEDLSLAASREPGPNTPFGRSLRNMADPPSKGDPDRVGRSTYKRTVSYPRDANDQGGVHSNSGIGNKLFTLLVDGGTHNGRTIASVGGIDGIALDLLYEAQINFLSPATDWRDLNFILRSAAIEVGMVTSQRQSVADACDAVEIYLPGTRTVFVDVATNAALKIGIPEVQGNKGPYTSLTIAADRAAGYPGNYGIVRINGTSGNVIVPRNTVFSQPMTLLPYHFKRVLTPDLPTPPVESFDPADPVIIQAAP